MLMNNSISPSRSNDEFAYPILLLISVMSPIVNFPDVLYIFTPCMNISDSFELLTYAVFWKDVRNSHDLLFRPIHMYIWIACALLSLYVG